MEFRLPVSQRGLIDNFYINKRDRSKGIEEGPWRKQSLGRVLRGREMAAEGKGRSVGCRAVVGPPFWLYCRHTLPPCVPARLWEADTARISKETLDMFVFLFFF